MLRRKLTDRKNRFCNNTHSEICSNIRKRRKAKIYSRRCIRFKRNQKYQNTIPCNDEDNRSPSKLAVKNHMEIFRYVIENIPNHNLIASWLIVSEWGVIWAYRKTCNGKMHQHGHDIGVIWRKKRQRGVGIGKWRESTRGDIWSHGQNLRRKYVCWIWFRGIQYKIETLRHHFLRKFHTFSGGVVEDGRHHSHLQDIGE